MTIDTSGNVGIGTTAPSQKLEVNGNISLSGISKISQSTDATYAGYNATKIDLTNPGVAGTNYVDAPIDENGAYGGFLSSGVGNNQDGWTTTMLVGRESYWNKFIGGMEIVTTHGTTWNSGTTSKLNLYTSSGGTTTNVPALTIDSSRNVGIGTTGPTHKLELATHTTAAGGIAFGTDVELYRSAANTLALASGDSFNIVLGALQIAGTSAIDSSRNATLQAVTATGTVSLSGLIYAGPVIRFSETTAAYNASNATKDSACSTDFGSHYQAAQTQDIIALWQGGMGVVSGTTTNFFNVYADATTTYYMGYDPPKLTASLTDGTYPIACVRKDAPLRFSRTTAAYNASNATKDSACSTDFGANYGAAGYLDTAALWAGAAATGTTVADFNLRDLTVTYFAFQGTANTQRLAPTTNATKPVACVMESIATGVDVAETIQTTDPAIIPGSILSADPAKEIAVRRSQKAYDPMLLGIAPTAPGLLLGEEFGKDQGQYTIIALAGRVPVIVSNQNGLIKIGDPVTSSNLLGVGIKAKQFGPIVGKALESTDHWSTKNCAAVSSLGAITWPEDNGTNPAKSCFKLIDGTLIGKIMVFVNLAWYDPDILLTDTGDLMIVGSADNPTVVNNQSSQTVTKIIAVAKAVIGSLETGLLKTAQLVADKISTRELTAENKILSPIIETGEIRIMNDELRITNDEETVVKINKQESGENKVSIFGDLLVKGEAEFDKVITDKLEAQNIKTETLTAREATFSAIYTDNIVSSQGSFSDLIASKIAAVKAELRELVAQTSSPESVETPTGSSLLGLAESWSIEPTPEESGLTSGVIGDEEEYTPEMIVATNLLVQGRITVDSLVTNKQLLVGSLVLTENSLIALDNILYLQPTGGKIDLLAGILIIEDNGQVAINGNLTVSGHIAASEFKGTDGDFVVNLGESGFGQLLVKGQGEQIVASINASGSATFAKLNIIEPALATGQDQEASASGETKSNASTGTSKIESGENQATIYSNQLSTDSLVYITPASDTQNQVLYVKEKNEAYFTVALNKAVENVVEFNWWIIN
ncbi:hypothetical protein ISS42_02385 [Candidatus Shapirobacteria bacterium]|nr:hypothetical protein [Candidatus Shapirobacteria bacterium]